MSAGGSLLTLGRGITPSGWPNAPRSPILSFPGASAVQPGPPWASCWTVTPTPTGLPFTPPSGPTIDFHRGNVMGVRVPGKPFVPGETDLDPSFLVTWYLYEQTVAWQQQICQFYRQTCGYTHIDFHRAAWLGMIGGVPGCTRQQALDSVALAASLVEFPAVNLAVSPGPQDPHELTPWIDDLVLAGMKIGVLAWQADQLLAPIDLLDYMVWVIPYLHAKGCKAAIHWMNDACAWWDPLTCAKYQVCDRFAFQAFAGGQFSAYPDVTLDYHYMQFDTEGPLFDDHPRTGGLTVAIEEVLRSLTTQQLVVAEYDMQAEFDDPQHRLEAYGDLKGRWLLAAQHQGRTVSGYFNGARQAASDPQPGVVV